MNDLKRTVTVVSIEAGGVQPLIEVGPRLLSQVIERDGVQVKVQD